VACCLADAISAQVPVVGASAGLKQDQWVRVTGDLRLTEDGALVSAVKVVEIEQPENPYLWAR
jgi:uncharacterized membrane protein YcgQ (UPF0703/DUF1980 family)